MLRCQIRKLESEILKRSEKESIWIFYLRLRNPDGNCTKGVIPQVPYFDLLFRITFVSYKNQCHISMSKPVVTLCFIAEVVNMFIITNRMNCALSLAGRKIH